MADQLELGLDVDGTGKRCSCGAELVAAVNDRRELCDRCILRKTQSGHRWDENPEKVRRHLQGWLAERRRRRLL